MGLWFYPFTLVFVYTVYFFVYSHKLASFESQISLIAQLGFFLIQLCTYYVQYLKE